jgi:GcrA cell cycle regulator
MPPSSTFWTDARIVELKQRWVVNQESASEIQHAMGAPSRSSVVGKIWRLGIGRGVKTGTRRVQGQQKIKTSQHHLSPLVYMGARVNGGLAPPMPEPKQSEPFKKPKRYVDLNFDECHWPGDGVPGPDLLCCAEPVVDGKAYCAAHCRMAYTRVPR